MVVIAGDLRLLCLLITSEILSQPCNVLTFRVTVANPKYMALHFPQGFKITCSQISQVLALALVGHPSGIQFGRLTKGLEFQSHHQRMRSASEADCSGALLIHSAADRHQYSSKLLVQGTWHSEP